MERMVAIAWRVFWVGLGAALVLVAQSLFAPRAEPLPPPGAPETTDLLAPHKSAPGAAPRTFLAPPPRPVERPSV